MFSGSQQAYDKFRATIKIWLPSLITLDGTDFKSDQVMVDQLKKEVEQSKPGIIQRYQGGSTPLATIPENSKAGAGDDDDVYEAMKKKQAVAGKQSAAAGNNATATYQYNQKAHRKFQSQKSLVERILKSHSEGNRFIRNEDL